MLKLSPVDCSKLRQGCFSARKQFEGMTVHNTLTTVRERTCKLKPIANGIDVKMAHGVAKEPNSPACNQDHQSANSNCSVTSKEPDSQDDFTRTEVHCLKQLLLVHLGMIQQQHGVIASKDSEIRTLRTENTMLQKRLERMSRRVGFRKSRGECVSSFIGESDNGEALPINTKRQNETRRRSVDESEEQCWQIKVPADDDTPCAKKLKPMSDAKKRSLSQRRVAHFPDEVDPGDLLEQQPDDDKNWSSAVATCPAISAKRRSAPASVVPVRAINRHVVGRASLVPPPVDGLLRTCIPYYTRQGELLVATSVLEDKDQLPPVHESQPVEVPSWRVLPFSNCYSLEGTENLEDDTFLKMHQKPEFEEKRRKRWDLQRLREQQVLEKLHGRSDPAKQDGDKKAALETLYQDPWEAHSIEVSEDVPVNVFGCAIPYISQSDFRLPWTRGRKPGDCKVTRRSSTKGKGS